MTIKVNIEGLEETLTPREKVAIKARFDQAIAENRVDLDVVEACKTLNDVEGIVTVQSCAGGHPYHNSKGYVDLRLSKYNADLFENVVAPALVRDTAFTPKCRWLLVQDADGKQVVQKTHQVWFPAGTANRAVAAFLALLRLRDRAE